MLKEHNTNHALINTFVSQFIKKQIPIYQTHFTFRLLPYGQEAFLAFSSVNIIFLLSALLFYFVIF